jgi:hypothetical protein
LAHRPPPAVASGGIFRQENPDGMVCYAQAMFYNANPQVGRGNATWQPIIGWDTLNWSVQVPEHPGPGSPDNACGTPSVPQPTIRLGWQAKLVPTTRVDEVILFPIGQNGPTSNVLRRMVGNSPMNRTH